MADGGWRSLIGASVDGPVTRLRVWAPGHAHVELVIESGARRGDELAMTAQPLGYFELSVEQVGAGDRYRYRVDGAGPFPDPASRSQPDGVHGASAVVDAGTFGWTDQAWEGVPPERLVLYELHVGTFTPEGTWRAAIERLPYLQALGVTAIELMPVADFPGARNWGYDGVALYAPARCYGAPDDLRALVDAAHAAGIAVWLDVVYNHVGPDGAYLFAFSPYYFTDRYPSPWGKSVNLDGPHADEVRALLVDNALAWVHDFHIDGLRLDATHAMRDASQRHFLAELAARVRSADAGRPVTVVAEDHRNLAAMIRPEAAGGWGLDGVWADDFHHQVRRALAGDGDGYYADYSGTTADLARTIEQGWFFTGQHSAYLDEPRGTDPGGLPPRAFVICLQNHDQIGNRAFGERLHHQIDLAAWRAVSVLLLTAPQTPLLFMGQEWAASTPFLYFTDHHDDLGRQVTAGRRREFARFAAFADPAVRARIPDPQAPATCEASRLRWDERLHPPHAGVLRLYAALLALRRAEPALQAAAHGPVTAMAPDADSLQLSRPSADGWFAIIVRLRGSGTVAVTIEGAETARRPGDWSLVLSSEDAAFADDARPPALDLSAPQPSVTFQRPSAVVLRHRERGR